MLSVKLAGPKRADASACWVAAAAVTETPDIWVVREGHSCRCGEQESRTVYAVPWEPSPQSERTLLPA